MAMDSKDPVVKKNVIDSLFSYGPSAIQHIQDIIESRDADGSVKEHGLNKIKMIRALNP
jgi:hypothetical protein